MRYKHQLIPIGIEYYIKDIGSAFAMRRDNPSPAIIDRMVANSGVREIAELIKIELGIKTPFFIEYSLIHSVLSPQARNRLTTFLYGEGEEAFLENIKNFYTSIVATSAYKGVTVYQHPDVFIEPSKGNVAFSISRIIGKTEESVQLIEKPLTSLIADKSRIYGYTEFQREYEEMLSVAERSRKDGILLEDLQYRLHSQLHALLLKRTEQSSYITIPIAGAEYDSSAGDLGFKRSKCHGVIFIYVANYLIEADDRYKALKRLHTKISNLVRYSSCNYLFNLGMSLLNSVRHYSISAAIGSIMSRNGSHNIGSHVLAALSHNVGTLPDDRVLYQYIQQRMDYIATVTTDFPTWTQPTMFVADMMKTFLSQRHLLDHIVESEGLHAFQFQNPNMTDEEWAAQKNCVKIHVRRKIGEEYKEFIDYTKRDAKVSLQDGTEECDISLAIPGGIIGEHAFYTILENIIRNAAKHSWAMGNNNAKNLDVYIDLTDEDEKVKFNVYTSLEASDCSELVDDLDQKLSQSFIDEDTGALRRENWGLAEMKISAGYLAGASIEAIGGIGDKKGTNEIIKPYVKSSKYLGYEFSIAKPKEILIVVISKKGLGDDSVRKELEKVGVFVKTVDEIKQEKRLNYRYVVHYDANELFDKDYHVKDDVLLPFRMLSGADIKDERLKRFIPTIQIDELKKCFRENAKASKNEIQKLVYNAYLKHLLGQIGIAEQRIGLIVSINENEKAGGNSLISDADILELMLEQNFAVCVDQYKAFAANEDNRKIIKCLESIRYKSSAKDKVIKFKHFSNKTIRELIAQRMCDWAGKLTEKPKDSWSSIVEHLRKKYFVSDAEGETPNELKPSSNKTFDDFEANVNSLLQKHPIDDFIHYVESVFENTKKLFKQYEEQIVTLPAGYKIDMSSEVKQENEGSDEKVALDGVKIVTKIKDVEKEDRHWIGYRRHAHTINGCKTLYVEPLSGTQTYLSQLTKAKNDLGLQMRLIENGLMRILVLDERVAKFLREHQKEVGPHYKAMNINVIDDKWVEAGSKSDSKPDGFFTGYTNEVSTALEGYAKAPNDDKSSKKLEDIKNNCFSEIDILIVHQGILDKWFDEFKSDKDKMRKLLEGFKRLVKYVVVTTGRGTPVNIPKEAHLLPFAVVESTLFKKYPEKLILTDTIMNVLPVGKKNDNSGGQE